MESEIELLTQQLAGTDVGKHSSLNFEGKDDKYDSEQDVQHIVDVMNGSHNMNSLRIGCCSLSKEASRAIAKALEKHPELKRAKWSDMFTSRSKEEIPDSLTMLSSGMMLAGAKLTELDLSDNALGPNGMKGITELLKSEVCYSLKELRLNNTGLGPTGSKMLAKCLDECYENSVKAGKPMGLTVFVAGRSRLENDGATELSKVFEKMKTLQEISINQDGINHPGITALARALESNPNLRLLSVNDNTLTEVGARSLARVLPRLPHLEVLDLGDCLVRSAGVKALVPALKELRKLKRLVLSFDELKADAAVELVQSLINKPNLELVDLDGNQLGESGIAAIEEAMSNLGLDSGVITMNDDEGSGDEDDDEEQGEADGPEEDEDGEVINDPQLRVTGVGLTPRDKFSAELCDEKIARLVQICLKVKGTDGKEYSNTCKTADNILHEILAADYEDLNEVESTLTNSLLVHLGLIKSEDKKFHAPSDINGPLYVLNHVVQQPYFPATSRAAFQLFVGNPNPKWSSCPESRRKLLECLYKF